MDKIFALVDCNNFYASCERIFNPSLKDKPVVVLSNNDGCVIARSNEAKAIGIGMGEPIFKCRGLVARHNVQVYSANFVLYGDMSRRVMDTLATFAPDMEIYSIDEAFLSLDGFKGADLYQYVLGIREKVKRDTGLPVSVGLAPTKTLAKIANRIAKKHAPAGGVFCLLKEDEIDRWLEQTAVEDIWGIGFEKAAALKRNGIKNALQLKQAPDLWIKKNLTVVSLKTVWELRGISCLPLQETAPDKKAIGTSRTFGREVASLDELQEAVAAYVAKSAEKLRLQGSVCGYIQVFVASNPFKGEKHYSNAAGIDVTPPSAYTPALVKASQGLLRLIFRPGVSYKRAGVLLMAIQPQNAPQQDLFDEPYQDSRRQRLMKTVDIFNRSANHGKIFWAAEGVAKPWFMKQSRKSKRFTTRWDELLEVRV